MVRQETTLGKVREDIVRRIHDGTLCPGDALSTATELAETYRVSYLTAHRTLHQLAKEGFCVRHRRRGTFVSGNPRLAGITAVGLPAYFETTPFHAHMIEELALQGMALGVNGVVGRAEHTVAFLERLISHGIRAVIRFPGQFNTENSLDEPDVWRLLQERGITTVIINDFWTDGGPFPHVCTDEAAGVAEMMDHLIALGHRRILFMNEVAEESRFRAMEAFRSAFRRHGLPYEADNVVNLRPPDWPEACKPMAKLMLERSTAAIVMYDMYALGILEELKSLGVPWGRTTASPASTGLPKRRPAG
jgi:DNA-binding LacI/PurR family transcriptional regulator